MIIGIDFDNTIADYTGVFYDVALDLGWIPVNVGQSKSEVKAYFIEQNNEPRWTELQGIVYGKEISRARPYAGCLDTLRKLKAKGHQLALISHKTRYPIIGEKVNFHEAATNWLKSNKFIDSEDAPFTSNALFYNEQLDLKVSKIAELNCDFFIDDLKRVLEHPTFPDNCKPIFFSPHQKEEGSISHWKEVTDIIC